MTTTKDRPIIFSGPMVRAILAGRKTQTRRAMKPQPTCEQLRHGCVGGQGFGFISDTDKGPDGDSKVFKCHYGQPGDRLWVRETYWHHKSCELEQAGFVGGTITNLNGVGAPFHANSGFDPSQYKIWRKRPSIHMPRWASRITLKITGVRVERLNEISEEDAIAEGIHRFATDPPMFGSNPDGTLGPMVGASAVEAFAYLWESINGKGSWGVNPWVWVIEFEQVKE